MAKVPAVSSLLFAALADSGCTKQRKNGKTIFRFHPLNDDPRADGEVVAIRPRTNRQKPGISKIKLSIQSRGCKIKQIKEFIENDEADISFLKKFIEAGKDHFQLQIKLTQGQDRKTRPINNYQNTTSSCYWLALRPLRVLATIDS